jgi:acyl-[acyl-carrier-protein]-phospholipid O-acyltransferase / long-chain-fatty-acid--[acyl-carrier-protein] ligase
MGPRSEHPRDADSLGQGFLRAAEVFEDRVAILDGAGALTFGELRAQVEAFAGFLRGRLDAQTRVGILLPAGREAALANVALACLGRTSVNLNASLDAELLQAPIATAGLTRILASKAFLAKLGRASPLPPLPSGPSGTIWLEDWGGGGGLAELEPGSREPAALLFSSGSTARPKGVVLSHANILANVRAFTEAIGFSREDRMLGVLPLFHSFGYTVTLWTPLLCGGSVVFHPDPLDARTLGELAAKHRPTFLLGTPAFYQAWLRRWEPGQIASVRAAVCGAQRLPSALADAWAEKFGGELLEGYGCTELSPVVAVNLPPRAGELRSRRGTVGRPLPGVAVRIVDPQTRAERPAGEEGLVLVKGPNVMQGYLGDPEATARAVRDGWYDTGDIGALDGDGFLRITDRLARFSKIGGEMISHGAVEEALQGALSSLCGGSECARVELAVTSAPDEQRGERLIVVHTPLPVPVEALRARLQQGVLPKLCLPRADAYVEVERLPRLPSGKLDLRALRSL